MYEGKEEIHKYMWYGVSDCNMGRIANQRKVPKLLSFKNFKSESQNILCVYMEDMCIHLPNTKFLCLTLWQGEVCTDTDDDANENDT